MESIKNPAKNCLHDGSGFPQILPDDEYNRALLNNVHPPNWKNPDPKKMYNLVVIGAGTAGLVTAAGAAGLGAKVALIEQHFMGGDCLNFGCVPSKSLIAASKEFYRNHNLAHSEETYKAANDNFTRIMERLRSIRAKISQHDSAQRFKDLGVDVFLGHAFFESDGAIRVNNSILNFRKAVISTGARAAVPNIPGLNEAGYYTNETIFSLTEMPKYLAILGAGPIGCELAQAFLRLGSQVTLIHKNKRILDKEDPEAAELLLKQFRSQGMEVLLNAKIESVIDSGDCKNLNIELDGVKKTVLADTIMIGVGRVPNAENLNLNIANIEMTKFGIKIDDYFRTTNPNVFAIGDVAMKYKFTHAADAAARAVIQNALFHGSKRASSLIIPWCTFTDPEIAHIGMYENEAKSKGMKYNVFRTEFAQVDRAVTDDKQIGFAKILTEENKDRIIGATIVGNNAGDLISIVSLAMRAKIGLQMIAETIFPYPTTSDVIKKTADAYNRTRLTPLVKSIFDYWFSWKLKV